MFGLGHTGGPSKAFFNSDKDFKSGSAGKIKDNCSFILDCLSLASLCWAALCCFFLATHWLHLNLLISSGCFNPCWVMSEPVVPSMSLFVITGPESISLSHHDPLVFVVSLVYWRETFGFVGHSHKYLHTILQTPTQPTPALLLKMILKMSLMHFHF